MGYAGITGYEFTVQNQYYDYNGEIFYCKVNVSTSSSN